MNSIDRRLRISLRRLLKWQIDVTGVALNWLRWPVVFVFRCDKTCRHGVSKLWVERPVRYSRALLETLSLIAYRQPITRGEIEDIRGVAVSSNIMKSLLEREWVKVVGHRDVPGKPAMYATTREFLDYFNLKSLDQLPPLADVKDLETMTSALPLDEFHDSRGEENEPQAGEPQGIAVDLYRTKRPLIQNEYVRHTDRKIDRG